MDYYKKKRPPIPSLRTGGNPSNRGSADGTPASEATHTTATATRRPSLLSKAFKTLGSQSSQDGRASPSSGNSDVSLGGRRLQKAPTNNSMLDRLSRRVSRDSTSSSLPSEDMSISSRSQLATLRDAAVVKHGPLASDASMLFGKAEYLVLTEEHLIKFVSAAAAHSVFPNIAIEATDNRRSSRTPSREASKDALAGSSRVEIPLSRMIALFKEEGTSPRFGIELWWANIFPAASSSNVRLFLETPQQRAEWMAEIHRTSCAKNNRNFPGTFVPFNVSARIQQQVEALEPTTMAWPLDIFPVVERATTQAATTASASLLAANASEQQKNRWTCYLVMGENICYLVRVFEATVSWGPDDIVMRAVPFGLTALVRFRATTSPRDERFVVVFRMPFQRPCRLELASRFYQQILDSFMKNDRYLKPAWPQHLQKLIFDIKGITSPLHLPAGDDFGGLRRTLDAYSATFACHPVKWRVNWSAEFAPEFCVLPSDDPRGYARCQLLAVFRALRYNDYFKSLSFRDIDFSCLLEQHDLEGYTDSICDVNRQGVTLDDEHRDLVIHSSVLFQEIHAICFSSGSLKSLDLTNVLNSQTKEMRDAREMSSGVKARRLNETLDLVRPILLLMQSQAFHCESLILNGNPLTRFDVSELVATLKLEHVKLSRLELARCSLESKAVDEIWLAMRGQKRTLEVINLSNNVGKIETSYIKDEAHRFQRLRKLNLAGASMPTYIPLLSGQAFQVWRLEALDLSNMKLSDPTINNLCGYMAGGQSGLMNLVRMNGCGLSARQVGALFKAVGQGREMVISLNNNPLEKEGMDGLCAAIYNNYCPTALFLDMIEFAKEQSYIQLLRALTVNRTIKLLSLAGTSTRGKMSSRGSDALSEFFSKNRTVRYLDLSGFTALLDESHLGVGFPRSLAGLRHNTVLRHLRVRSQVLSEDVGGLGTALAENQSLLTIDIQDNGFSLSDLAYLVKNLDKNTAVVQFSPFAESAVETSINASIDRMLPVPHPRLGRAKAPRTPDAELPEGIRMLVTQLREEWSARMAELDALLARNRMRSAGLERGVSERIDDLSVCDYTELFGGLAAVEDAESKVRQPVEEGEPWTRSRAGSSLVSSPRSRVVSGAGARIVSVQQLAAPRRVSNYEANESQTDTGGEGGVSAGTSGFSTTPDLVGSPIDTVAPGGAGAGSAGTHEVPEVGSPRDPLTPVEGPVAGPTEWDEDVVDMMGRHGFWNNKGGRTRAAAREGQDEDGNEADRESGWA